MYLMLFFSHRSADLDLILSQQTTCENVRQTKKLLVQNKRLFVTSSLVFRRKCKKLYVCFQSVIAMFACIYKHNCSKNDSDFLYS